MEVHAHTHTARKKWTHYFWEFLMLFLAVFCGFYAEYQLEHKIEKEKGKQYILSLHEDLETDTLQCNWQIKELTGKEAGLKNMANCFDTIIENPNSTECLKEVIINSYGFPDFIYTDRTIQQLKYAGGLRLIQDKAIADSITAYDAVVREMHIHQEVLENQQQITINAHNSMIGYGYRKKISDGGKLILLTNNTRELNKYFNEITSFRRGCYRQLQWITRIKAKATSLLIFLDKKGFNN
jgi:hypothetical protein